MADILIFFCLLIPVFSTPLTKRQVTGFRFVVFNHYNIIINIIIITFQDVSSVKSELAIKGNVNFFSVATTLN